MRSSNQGGFDFAWRLVKCSYIPVQYIPNTNPIISSSAGISHTTMSLSDVRPSCDCCEFADWFEQQNVTHTRGQPNHPMKSQILLDNYYV